MTNNEGASKRKAVFGLCGMLFCSVILACLLFTGCMTEQAKEQQKKNEQTAVAFFKDWLPAHYDRSRINSAKGLTETVADGFLPVKNVTDYVRVEARVDGKDCSFVYNVESGEIFTSEYLEDVNEEVRRRVYEALGMPEGTDDTAEVRFRLPVDGKENKRVLPYGIQTLDEVLEHAEMYDFFCEIRYDAETDFSAANVGRLFRTLPVEELTLTNAVERQVNLYADRWVCRRAEDGSIRISVQHNTCAEYEKVVYVYNDLYYDLRVSRPDASEKAFTLTMDRICADDHANYTWCVPNSTPNVPYEQDGQQIVWEPALIGQVIVIPQGRAYDGMYYVDTARSFSVYYEKGNRYADKFLISEDHGETYPDHYETVIRFQKEKP